MARMAIKKTIMFFESGFIFAEHYSTEAGFGAPPPASLLCFCFLWLLRFEREAEAVFVRFDRDDAELHRVADVSQFGDVVDRGVRQFRYVGQAVDVLIEFDEEAERVDLQDF